MIESKTGMKVVFLFTALFSVAYGFLFSISPLGLAPQLDSRELLELALQLSRGALPAEPFYRAMGYPFLLSLFFRLGLDYAQVISAALACGVIFHLFNTWLVVRLSKVVWGSGWPSVLSGFLYGLNPVVVFFTIDILDIGLGLLLALSGLFLLLRRSSGNRFSTVLLGGFCLGLSCVVRPHFLFLLPAVLFSEWVRGESSKKIRMSWMAALLISLALPLFVQSALGWKHSGDWQWMPWQGAYNLYAANASGANGKYFTQKYIVDDRDLTTNPARAESEVRYGLETHTSPPYEIDEMNGYWRTRFMETVKDNPLDWLTLLSRKCYYAINDFEQYNNKTYSFHAERSALLQWNPISFGWMCVLGIGGCCLGWTRKYRQRLIVLIVLAVCYGLSLVLFYASARFRIPIHALLALLAGGFLTAIWRQFKYTGMVRKVILTALVMLIVGGITFSSFQSVRDRSTYTQDRMLLAGAGLESGDDLLAAEMAKQVVENHPERVDARRIFLIAYFNLRTLEGNEGSALYGNWASQQAMIDDGEWGKGDYQVEMILGLIYWHSGYRERAIEEWKASVQSGGSDQAFVAAGLLKLVQGDPFEDRYLGMKQGLERLLKEEDS